MYKSEKLLNTVLWGKFNTFVLELHLGDKR